MKSTRAVAVLAAAARGDGSTGSTWAVEWFKDSDGSVNVIFSASTAGWAPAWKARP